MMTNHNAEKLEQERKPRHPKRSSLGKLAGLRGLFIHLARPAGAHGTFFVINTIMAATVSTAQPSSANPLMKPRPSYVLRSSPFVKQVRLISKRGYRIRLWRTAPSLARPGGFSSDDAVRHSLIL